jgi:serpin B
MVRSENFSYFETPALQALRLPFGDGDLVMDILLPAKTSTLSALEADLTSGQWKTWQAQYASRSGTLELPRFELKSHYRLNEPLQTLGIRRAFQPQSAQFASMVSPARGPARSGGWGGCLRCASRIKTWS